MSDSPQFAAAPPRVVLVPDGACEPGTDTSLVRAHTPHLDALCFEQGVGRLVTIPDGWHPGTEVGVARLAGSISSAPPGRGWLEAAALDIEVPAGHAAWRLDLRSGHVAPGHLAAALRDAVGLADQSPRAELADQTAHLDPVDPEVHVRAYGLPDHRHLLVGPASWGDAAVGHDRPQPTAWDARLAPVERVLGVRLHAWGRAARPSLPARPGLAVLPGSSAVRGIARLVGASLLDDLEAGLQAITNATYPMVLLHDAAPDEAAHTRDRRAKVDAIERFDALVVGPVLEAAAQAGATVLVAPDHGCDPATGEHTADPVPATWPGAPGRGGRLTEAATGDLPAVDAAQTVLGPWASWEDAA